MSMSEERYRQRQQGWKEQGERIARENDRARIARLESELMVLRPVYAALVKAFEANPDLLALLGQERETTT